MRMYDVIANKRDGKTLTETEIHYVIKGFTEGTIPDYQMSALLMAIYFQGMTLNESAILTKAMVDSGARIDLSPIEGIKVDKHSTGGVGDTTTLILAPLVASVGVKVAKMSGRGLGHTGGTLDKLESFPGFSIEVSNETFIQLVNEQNIAVIGQTDTLAPADKQLYSLRDVTATVNAIPLIASSIMSKKIASGADAIVLDVKTGSGAFMKEEQDAIELARTMVAIGEENNVKTTAIISNMDEPLGHAVGNILEVQEAIATLQNNGPEDITKLSLTLGAHMVVHAGLTTNFEAAYDMLAANLKNGKALTTFKQFIHAQGGQVALVDHPDQFPKAKITQAVKANQSGFVSAIDAETIGKAAMILGAGRETKDMSIDLTVGVIVHQKIGSQITAGDRLCTVHGNDAKRVEKAMQMIEEGIAITDSYNKKPLIIHTITKATLRD